MTKEQELKQILARLNQMRRAVKELEDAVTSQLGPGACFIETKEDQDRVFGYFDEPDFDVDSIHGSLLDEDVLQKVWDTGIRYCWYYKDTVFVIEPFDDVKEGPTFRVTHPDGKEFEVHFNELVPDVVDCKVSMWELVDARVHGIADSYKKAPVFNVKLNDYYGK